MEQILEVMGITEEDVKKKIIGIIPRYTSLPRYAPRVVYDALPEELDNLRRMDVLLLRECYKEWQDDQKKRAHGDRTQFEKDFTEEYWTDFLNDHGPMTTPAPENQPPPPAPVVAPAAPASVTSAARDTRPTVSFKVDAKDIPKLPKGNKTIQGPAFDRWQILFENKLDQADCSEIIDPTVDEPDELDDDDEVEAWHQRDKWVRAALLQATYETNAWSVIDRKKSGRANYNALLARYQSATHQQEDAAHAEESLKNLYFDRSSKFTAETFLAKFEDYVKRINEGLGAGETFPQTLLASKFLAALQHPEYRTWKEIHKDDGWDDLRVEYIKKSMALETAGRLRYGDRSDKYNIRFGRGGRDGRGGRGRGGHGEGSGGKPQGWKSDGSYLKHSEYTKLTNAQKKQHREAMKNKKAAAQLQTATELPKQYTTVQYQVSTDLPPGTIVVPTPNDDQSVLSMPTTVVNRATIPSMVPTPTRTNQQRAEAMVASVASTPPSTVPVSVNSAKRTMVQQPDGTFKICFQKFRISPQVAGRMSVQNLGLLEEAIGELCSDGGTNISVLGKIFRILFETGRYVDMTGFANGLEKLKVQICSGVATLTLPDGSRVLLGIHEGAYLPDNNCSLISTGQAREAGTFIDDRLHRHGGQQCIRAEATYSEDYVSDVFIPMTAKDGLCTVTGLTYPTDEELKSLPYVWLTSNAEPWDPAVLDKDDGEVIVPCGDGTSQFNVATNMERLDEAANFVKQVARQCNLAQGLYYLTGMVWISNLMRMTYKVFLGSTKSRSPAAHKTVRDWEWFCPKLGWVPIEVVKRTLDATTQLAGTVPLRYPMKQHVNARFPQLNRRRLAETFATDTLFSSVPALGGYTCAQLYVGTKSKYTAVYPMKNEREGPQTLEDFTRDKGAPYAIRNNNSKMQAGTTWTNIL